MVPNTGLHYFYCDFELAATRNNNINCFVPKTNFLVTPVDDIL